MGCKRVDGTTAVIWKTLLTAEKRFTLLKTPGHMQEVYLGAEYEDGTAVEAIVDEVAA